jgi:type IX secretion system PorP/SprF family membrane protein
LKKFRCIVLLVLLLPGFGIAQQYPWLTQYRSNLYMFNPAFCGTKRIMDFRMFYRNQWTGFEGAPRTYAASLHFRYAGGKLGTGAFVYRDAIGPFINTYSAFTLAYHLKFDDTELSIGFQGNYTVQNFIGSYVTLHNSIDKSINQFASDKAQGWDGSLGLALLNDRFYVGFGANNLLSKELRHYKGDPVRLGRYQNVPAYSVSAGYNYAENTNYTFESSIMALYTTGVPFYFDYTLRVHFYKSVFTGVSVRLKDAIGFHVGATMKDAFQICYSYDLVTSPLFRYQSGSHEIKLVFSSNLGLDQKKKGFNGRFLKQRFQYLL